MPDMQSYYVQTGFWHSTHRDSVMLYTSDDFRKDTTKFTYTHVKDSIFRRCDYHDYYGNVKTCVEIYPRYDTIRQYVENPDNGELYEYTLIGYHDWPYGAYREYRPGSNNEEITIGQFIGWEKTGQWTHDGIDYYEICHFKDGLPFGPYEKYTNIDGERQLLLKGQHGIKTCEEHHIPDRIWTRIGTWTVYHRNGASIQTVNYNWQCED